MSAGTKIRFKKWLFGAFVSLFLSALVAGAGMVAGASWQVFFATFCAAALTHFGAWNKEHPASEVDFGDEDETKT